MARPLAWSRVDGGALRPLRPLLEDILLGNSEREQGQELFA